MKFAAICLATAVYAATCTLANDLQPAAATAPSVSDEAAPEPTGMSAEDYAILDARQVQQDPNVPEQAATQFPTVTTDWRPTMLPNGQITYWEDAYTQTFAKVPGQLPSPGAGEIGYGTLTKKGGKEKRAEATPTGPVATVIAQPIVMLMQTTIILQPVQRVTEIQVIETVLELSSSVPGQNATGLPPSFNASSTGIFLGTGTAVSYGTSLSGMATSTSANNTEPWLFRRYF